MPNIGTIISGHNKAVLNPKELTSSCNCRNKQDCPLDNNCLTSSLVFKAEITNDVNDDYKIYIGAAETTFKERYRNHTKDMRHRKYLKSTELSKYFWTLKDEGKTATIRWRVLKRVQPKTQGANCKLCLAEKLSIINTLKRSKRT